MFWQQMVNAFNLGAMYSLLAIGYTMVYGIMVKSLCAGPFLLGGS
jgi:branched-subunit amino acid ABC-type transport system permease component